jgi:hypothetical protein
MPSRDSHTRRRRPGKLYRVLWLINWSRAHFEAESAQCRADFEALSEAKDFAAFLEGRGHYYGITVEPI